MSLVVRGAGFLVDAFYRRVKVGGAVPSDGPVLVVANHTHQLVDVALALRAIDRPTTLLAKATLFRAPPMSWLVKSAHALPVHRARDGARDSEAKRETAHSLAETERVLARAGCVLVFPEGVSHEEPGVYRAHSGAARIALGAVERGARDLRIVPMGLLYRAKRRPRSEAATLIGEPIDWRGADVETLTARIEEALRKVTLHLEEWEDLPLVQAALLLEPNASSRVGARDVSLLAAGIARMRAHAPRELARVRQRVDVHARRLRQIGVHPDESAQPRKILVALRQLAGVVLAPLLALTGVVTRRRTLVDRARSLVHNARAFARRVARGSFTRDVNRERHALLVEMDRLLDAGRRERDRERERERERDQPMSSPS